MEPFSPIFILSCERSGSTLLQFILDAHPDICCPGEMALGALCRDLRVAVSRSFGLPFAKNPLEREEVEKREVRRAMFELLSRFTQTQGKKLWCDKTPYNLKYLEPLEWAFPDARYVCLHRNALDVVQSCLELPEKEFLWWALPYVVKHQRNLAAAFLDNWAEKTGALLELESRNSRTFRLKYEDLVADPPKVLIPLFRFLGVDWDPSLPDRVFTLPRDPSMGGDYKIHSTRRIEKDRVGKGAGLSPTLLSLIPSDLRERRRDLHHRLGYE